MGAHKINILKTHHDIKECHVFPAMWTWYSKKGRSQFGYGTHMGYVCTQMYNM